MCLLSLSLSVSPHGVGDGCPKAPEFTRPRSRSWQENPSPSVTLSQFQIPEIGLELAQFGHVMTPRPERWSHFMQAGVGGVLPVVMCMGGVRGGTSQGEKGTSAVPGLGRPLV